MARSIPPFFSFFIYASSRTKTLTMSFNTKKIRHEYSYRISKLAKKRLLALTTRPYLAHLAHHNNYFWNALCDKYNEPETNKIAKE